MCIYTILKFGGFYPFPGPEPDATGSLLVFTVLRRWYQNGKIFFRSKLAISAKIQEKYEIPAQFPFSAYENGGQENKYGRKYNLPPENEFIKKMLSFLILPAKLPISLWIIRADPCYRKDTRTIFRYSRIPHHNAGKGKNDSHPFLPHL